MHFAIVQTWGLGDLVMTTPVIAEFRRLYPSAKLTLVVQGGAQGALLEGSPLVDEVRSLPPRSQKAAYLKFFLSLRRRKIDAVFIGTRIDAYWLPVALRFLAGVPVIIGDGRKLRRLYSIEGTVHPEVHRVDRMLTTFAAWSGVRPLTAQFPIPLADAARIRVHSLLAGHGMSPGRYLIIHPGSSVKSGTDKRIPAAVARRVADAIIERRPDLSIAFIFGPDEVDFMAEFVKLGERQFVISDLSLSETKTVLAQAAGFIGTDSGVGHVAAALGIPTITVVGPTIASETAPYGDLARVVMRREQLECQPCWNTPLYGRCPYGVRCMNELPESEIVETAANWTCREL